jgi:hypothetical protein
MKPFSFICMTIFMSFIFVTTLGITECLNCNFFKKNVYSGTESSFVFATLVVLCIYDY